MSRFCGDVDVEPIIEAAQHWRKSALLGKSSVLTGQSLWTDESLEALNRDFVQRPDAGSGKFLEKLKQQLDSVGPMAKKLAAEMMWLMYLCPSSLTPNHKRLTVQTVWDWSGEPFPSDSPWLADERTIGIGSAGPGFNQNQWRELVFLIALIQAFRLLQQSEQQRLLSDGWAFAEWLENVPDSENRQLRHMLLFLQERS